jgi:hypothetical protein
MNAQKRYQCNVCSTIYEFEQLAMECCPVMYNPWECQQCKKIHDTRIEAEDCCQKQEAQKQ